MPLRWRWGWGNPRMLQPAGLVYKTVNKGLYLRQGGSQRLSFLCPHAHCDAHMPSTHTHIHMPATHIHGPPTHIHVPPTHTYMCMSPTCTHVPPTHTYASYTHVFPIHAHMPLRTHTCACPLHTHMPLAHTCLLRKTHTCPYTHRTPTHTHATCTCAPYTHKHTSTYTHVPPVHITCPLYTLTPLHRNTF